MTPEIVVGLIVLVFVLAIIVASRRGNPIKEVDLVGMEAKLDSLDEAKGRVAPQLGVVRGGRHATPKHSVRAVRTPRRA